MNDKPPVIVPDRRGDRTHRLWSALPEILIAVASLIGGIAYLGDRASFAMTAVGALPGLAPDVWLVALIGGAAATLVGSHRDDDRQALTRAGLCALSLADLAYAACLLANRGGQASLTTLMLMANGCYLMARANRWGRA